MGGGQTPTVSCASPEPVQPIKVEPATPRLSATLDKNGSKAYADWALNSTAPHSDPDIFFREEIRKYYPNHEAIFLGGLELLEFPHIDVAPIPDIPINASTYFLPLPRRSGPPGILLKAVSFGAFDLTWKGFSYILYIVTWSSPYFGGSQILLHKGGEAPMHDLIMAVGAYANALHDEIWVFEGYWYKSHPLWVDVQKADWGDIILHEEFKQAFRDDIESFFESEPIYREYSIPWKRGIIMHGPPGNGKTISLKALMKYTAQPSLYVRSGLGSEWAISEVFEKARQLSPCIVVIEDLDTLIHEGNRSYFLNQLDGLQENDGLLLLATTNHLERLDPSISQRPSRFDRKYFFDDPDEVSRRLYVKYWQAKLKGNKKIQFPDNLVVRIAAATPKFSFAYLKEAFVSTLVVLAGDKKDRSFEEVIMEQIEILRKGMPPAGQDPRGNLV